MLSEAFALGASGRRFLDEMLKRVKVTKPVGDAANKIGGKLSGRSFLITGTLSKPRKHFEELITSNGGRLASGVSSKLDVLLVGTDAGSKLTKAQALGIKIIEEPEFCDMVK